MRHLLLTSGAILLALAGCSFGSATGRAVGPAEIVDGRAILVVELDAGTVSGSSDVALSFAVGDAACRDPAATIDLTDLRIGAEVSWRRVSDGVAESDPPIIAVTDVQIAC